MPACVSGRALASSTSATAAGGGGCGRAAGPRHRAGSGGRGLGEDLGEAPVQDLDLAERSEHDVLRLQVPVEDAASVRVGDRAADVGQDLEEAEKRELGPVPGIGAGRVQHLGQRAAPDELHREEEPALGREADLVDGDDPGVLKLGGRLRLLDEALGDLARRAAPAAAQDLHGHVAPEVAVERPVDHPHPAAPDLRLDEVAAGGAEGVSVAALDVAPRLALVRGRALRARDRRRARRDRRRPLLGGQLHLHRDLERGAVRRRGTERTDRARSADSPIPRGEFGIWRNHLGSSF